MRSETEELAAPIVKLINKTCPANIYLAYSGGVDSTVLVKIITELKVRNKINQNLHAIHINHNLNPKAHKWAEHCRAECAKYPLEFSVFKVTVNTDKPSLESEARKARYAEFEKIINNKDALILAQHQDDQVETFFLRLFRGAGPTGLAAMRPVRKLGPGMVLRPWLNLPKAKILDYALKHNLRWIEDDSNLDTGFDRNYLRKEIIPKIKKRWPGLNKTVSRTAKILAHTADKSLVKNKKLKVNKLKNLKSQDAENLVYQWLKYLKVPTPTHKIIQNIVKEVALAKEDAKPHITWSGGEVRRYAGKLYYFTKPKSLARVELTQTLSGRELIKAAKNKAVINLAQTTSGTIAKLKFNFNNHQGLKIDDNDKISVKFPAGGEKIKPAFGKHTKDLKKIFQEQKIPPWDRRRIPLIFVNGKLAAVSGICVSDDFFTHSGGVKISLIKQ